MPAKLGCVTRGGLPERIAQYFAVNRDEELLYEDALVKFDCTPKQLLTTLARLRAIGAIETPKIIRAAR